MITGTVLYYFGLLLIAVAVVAGFISLVIWKARKKHLQAVLEQEYGIKKKKTL